MGRLKQFDPDVAVSTAMDVFWWKGYGATTPADLVNALGIGKGSLYNAFGSKHSLFEQALRRYGEERVASLTETLNRPGPVRDRLRAAIERLAAPENVDVRQRGCLAVNTATELGEQDEAAVAIVCEVFQRMEDVLQATVEEGQQNGELDLGQDPRDIASLFLATIIGMAVFARAGEPTARLNRVARAAMALI